MPGNDAMRARLAGWVWIVLAGCTSSPGDASRDSLTGMYVDEHRLDVFFGSVDATDAKLAVTIRDDGFTDVYVCGGDDTFDTISRWFCPASLAEDGVEVSFDRDGWRMIATRDGDRVVGSLFAPDVDARTVGGGQEYTFEAPALEASMGLGVFQRREGPDNCSGAIVWQRDTRPIEMIGTYCFDDGVMKQVTPVLKYMPDPNAALIRVQAGSGDDAVEVDLLNNELF